MPRKLKSMYSEKYFLVILPTVNGECSVLPTPFVNEALAGVYGHHQHQLNVTIYALTVLPDLTYLLVRASKKRLERFIVRTQRDIAQTIQITRADESVRICQITLQEIPKADLEEAFLDVVTSPVKHGLVDHPSEWPGLSSYMQ